MSASNIALRPTTRISIYPLAKELVALQPDVILANSTPVTAALQRETRTIPIVFVSVSDPIGEGLVASLARPGGNVTGLLQYETSITGKWLAMLKEIAPRLTRAAVCGNPKTTPFDCFLRAAKAVASSLGIDVRPSRPRPPPILSAPSSPSRACRTAACCFCRIPPPFCIAISSSRWRRDIACRQSTRSVSSSRPAV